MEKGSDGLESRSGGESSKETSSNHDGVGGVEALVTGSATAENLSVSGVTDWTTASSSGSRASWHVLSSHLQVEDVVRQSGTHSVSGGVPYARGGGRCTAERRAEKSRVVGHSGSFADKRREDGGKSGGSERGQSQE